MLLGLFHMHKYGFFHRDMKPENLLLTGKKVKIADFGLAREIRSIPPFTEYVSTRYYRAPECILRSQNYNSPVDIWAVGCIMAEMYITLGSPNRSNWHEGVNQANKIGMKYPQSSGTDLANIVIGASPEAIDLMKQMLKWSPSSRATAASLLNHPFFNGCGYDLKRITNTNFFNDFGDVKAFNKTNRRFRPNNNNNENNNNDEKNELNEKKEEIKKDNEDNNMFSKLLNDTEGLNEKKEEIKKDNEDNNMFSKLLNDTEGFNKLLNQLKKEENEENKYFEKKNYKYNGEDKLNKKQQYENRLEKKKIINEEKENDSDSENNNKNKWNKNDINANKNEDKYNDFNFDFNENKNNNFEKISKKDDDDEFSYLFNSDKKSNLRSIGLKDNFRKEAGNKQKDEFDYLFNEKKSKEDRYDNIFQKNNEKDYSNIDSEINKILSKDIGLSNNNPSNKSNNNFLHKNFNNNNNYNLNNNTSNKDLLPPSFKFKSQKNYNNNYNNIGLDKPYERNNLKPIINGGRRAGGGGGLMAIGYEPKRKSIFDNDNFGKGLGLNKRKELNNNKYNYGFKRDLGPIFGNNGNNNLYGRKGGFGAFEKNNPLFNQFNNDIIGAPRRKRNFYSSPNIQWDIL